MSRPGVPLSPPFSFFSLTTWSSFLFLEEYLEIGFLWRYSLLVPIYQKTYNNFLTSVIFIKLCLISENHDRAVFPLINSELLLSCSLILPYL